MTELFILAAVAFAGSAEAPGAWALIGAGALTLAGWWRKVRLLRQHPQVPFSTKMTTYLVVSVLINLGLASASYLVGHALRRWLA